MLTSKMSPGVLLNIIINSYFLNSRCILLFTDKLNFDFKFDVPVVIVKSLNIDKNVVLKGFGCQSIVINHEQALGIFKEVEFIIRQSPSERFNDRKYVILEAESHKIFNTKEVKYVSDILVANLNSSNGTYTLVTHQYTGINPNQGVFLDLWFLENLTFLYNTNLFPDKMSNQNGREFVVGTFTYEPYSIIDVRAGTFDGTEMSFILEFIRKYNLTAKYHVVTDMWGELYDNFTGTGLLGCVAEDKTDVAFAAVYTWEEDYSYLDHTKPLIRSGVTCLVPAPKLISGGRIIFSAFAPAMWGCLGVTWVLSVITVFAIISSQGFGRVKSISTYFMDAFFRVTAIYLVQSLKTRDMKGWLLRSFLALVFLQILLATNAFNSGLSSSLITLRYKDPIKTVKDLVRSGLKWGANSDAWVLSIQDVQEEPYKTIVDRFTIIDDQGLEQLTNFRNFAFSIERLPFGHFAVGSYIKNEVIGNYRVMKEDIYWTQCIFLTRKSSVYTPLLDDFILKVAEAGLVAYWETKTVAKYLDANVQRAVTYYLQNTDERMIVKLKWSHVEGAFFILGTGYLTAGGSDYRYIELFCAEFVWEIIEAVGNCR